MTLNIADGGSLGLGTYPLIGYGSLSGGGTGAFSLGLLRSSAGDTSSFTIDAGNVIDLVISAPGLTNGQWGVNSGGTWSTAGNWSGGNVPGGNAQDTAVFGTVLTSGTANVVLDGSRSLSSLGFSTTGANSYVISASNGSTLTLSNTGGAAATISDSGGNHTIAAPITLGSNLSVTAAGGSTLTVSGAIGETNGRHDAERQRRRDADPFGQQHLQRRRRPSTPARCKIGNGGSGEGLASPSITMSNNATVAFNHADPLSYGGAISGSGQLIKLGAGVLDLSGTSTYSGPTTISAGTLELDGNGNNLPTATALTIASSGVLDLAGVPQTVGSLSGSAGAIVTNHYSAAYPSTLTVAPSSGSTTLRREHHRQRRLGAFRQRRIDPQRHEHVHRRDDGQRRHAGHRRPQRVVRQRVGDDRRRRAAGFGQRRGHRRIACGLVAGQFGRGCPQRGGVGPGDDRRI